MRQSLETIRDAAVRYLRMPLLPRTRWGEQLEFVAVAAGTTLAAILLIHTFSASGLTAAETAIHALTLGVGFTAGLVLAGRVIWRLAGRDRRVVHVWVVMAAGFVLGLGFVGVLESAGPLATVSARAAAIHGPASMLPRLIPVWLLITAYLARSEILASYEKRLAGNPSPPPEPASGTETQAWIDLDSTRCRTRDIARIDAEENYCRIHLVSDSGTRSFLVRSTMQDLLERLPGAAFVRVHRSHIVGRRFVDRMERRGRRFVVILADGGDPVPISRSRLDETVDRLTGDAPADGPA